MTTLRFENHSFIDPVYKGTEADVLYSVTLNNSAAYLYLLLEQQSSVDPLIAFRLLVYMVRIMERHLKQNPGDTLPLVLPMVIYAGHDPWTAPLEIFPLFGELEELARETLLKPYQFMDINRISDEVLREQMLFGLVAFTLKHRQMADFREFLHILMPWILEAEAEGSHSASLVRSVLKYVIDRVPQGDKDLFVQEARHYLSPGLQGDLMTIAQQWEEDGRQKGKQEGLQEGVQLGKADLLLRQLRRRFGNISASITQRIMDADVKTLSVWGEKIINAADLEEIFTEEDTVE